MTDRILKQLIELEIIEQEEAEIYRFGLEALILKSIHYVSYLLIAIFSEEVVSFLIFFIAFLLLRKNAGGYHANTRGGCYIASCMTVLSACIFMKHIVFHEGIIAIGIVLLVVADSIIFRFAPLGNKNRELDEEETRYFRKRCIWILIIENMIVLLLRGLRIENYVLPIVLAIICQAILLLLQKIKK